MKKITKEIGSSEPNHYQYPLIHRLSFWLNETIQRARSQLNYRVGDTSFKAKEFQIVPISLTIRGLDPAFEGYRLVHLSDIHLGQWITPERLEGVIDLVNQRDPDLVAITGDFVSYVLDDHIEEQLASLARLSPKDATVAVLGNHDHWVGADNIRLLIKSGNVKELSNDVFTVTRNQAMLHIAGLDDVIENRHRLDLVQSKLPPSGPAILLVHEPDFAEVSARTGRFSLQLSGHSHGGQIVIPKLGTPVRSKHFWKYPLGRYQVGDMVQYTNRGLGTNLFWSRINCPPEITVFTLHSGNGQEKGLI